MATIDPNIALGYKPIQIENPINQYAAMAQIESGQQANQLNALKLQEMQRGMGEEEGARNYLTTADLSTPEGRAGLARFGKTGLGYGKLLADQDESKLKRTELTNKIKLQDMEQYREATKNLIFNPSDNNSKAHLEDNVKLGRMTPEEAQNQWETIAPMNLEQRKQYFAMRGTKAEEFFKQIAANNAPTTEQKNFQYGQQNPAFVNYQMTKARAGASSPNIYLPPQEKAEGEARGKFLVKDYETVDALAKNAAKTLPAIDTNLSLLNNGFRTGFTTETQAGAASILSALGVPDAEKFATNAQIFKAKTNDIVLQKQLEQKGVQTATDADRITSTGAQLGNTSAANEFLLNVAKAQLKRDIEQRNFYNKWWQKNKTYDGAEDAWFTTEGDKSLFDRPELKKYNVNPNKSNAPVKIKNDEEYAKLKSGTMFIDPNGQPRTKP